MEKHVDLIGILWIALGAMTFFAGFVVFWILFGISFLPDIDVEAPIILRTIGAGIGAFFLILAVPKILAGIGLLRRAEWGRVLTLIVSFFSLLNFPFGTALAIYSFVILIKDETIRLFRPEAAKAG